MAARINYMLLETTPATRKKDKFYMHIPKVLFTQWKKWSERNSLKDKKYPGIYLLAHFNRAPFGRASSYAKQIIYIGETHGSLGKRWRQFDRAAFKRKSGHSGGATYRSVIGGRSSKLYVAAFPVNKLNDKIRPVFIKYIERKLLWNFLKKWNSPPKCNKG